MNSEKRIALPSLVIATFLMLAIGVASATSDESSDPSGKLAPNAEPAGERQSGCPSEALTLTANAPAPATEAALSEASKLYPAIDTEEARAIGAVTAKADRTRRQQIVQECGREAARKSVVVSLSFPRMKPSASLSQGVVFVSRFDDGYRVWEVAH